MTRMVLILRAASAAFLSPATALNADVLLIEEVRQAERMQLPVNGMSKDVVRSRFGAPAQTHAPVGEPPITRWVYPDYTVYFEHQNVLEVVVHR